MIRPRPGASACIALLEQLGLGHRIDYKPRLLSGGERQRVAIARALVNRPRLVLADEPTAALDKDATRIVIELLKQTTVEHGAAVIMVTHDYRIIECADRLVHMVDGRIVSDVVLHDALRICEFLRAVEPFRALTPAQLTHVAEKMTKRHFAAGETIVREGETGEEFFLISDGEVDVVRADQEVARLGRRRFFRRGGADQRRAAQRHDRRHRTARHLCPRQVRFPRGGGIEPVLPRSALPRLFRAPLTAGRVAQNGRMEPRSRSWGALCRKVLLPAAANSPMRRRVAEIAPARGREEIESAPAGARRAEARLRDSELFLLVLALGAGVAAGLGVVLIDLLLGLIRHFAFAIPAGGHLSDAAALEPARLVLMPVLGGILVGLSSLLLRRWRPREVVDAIEANALFGGRMSLGDSLGLVWVTILSGGFGASVGLEAAYTQLGAALASRLGRSVDLRRDDVRTLVGCGAAGAIAAAFNAPLTGAFYAFELIIGSYTLQALAPVGIAALTGALVVRGLVGSNPIFVVWHDIALSPSDYLAFFGLGLASAGLGILTMKGVTSTEALFRAQAVPRWARPALGGLIVGLIALPFPQVLGSGHGGILSALAFRLRSAVSGRADRGQDHRLGDLDRFRVSRRAVQLLAVSRQPVRQPDRRVADAARAGSRRRSADLCAGRDGRGRRRDRRRADDDDHAGAGNHRRLFGDDRGHGRRRHRGDRGAPLVWLFLCHLAVSPARAGDPQPRGCRLDQRAVDRPDDAARPGGDRRRPAARRIAPPLSGRQHQAGVRRRRRRPPVRASSIRPRPNGADGAGEAKTVGDLVTEPAPFLLPGDDLRTALDRFSQAAQETLPVIDNPDGRRVLGYLSEAYALRRYAHELERHRGAQQDDAGIFSPTAGDATATPTEAQK